MDQFGSLKIVNVIFMLMFTRLLSPVWGYHPPSSPGKLGLRPKGGAERPRLGCALIKMIKEFAGKPPRSFGTSLPGTGTDEPPLDSTRR